MVNPDHAAREHSVWSASSTDRNWNCSGALALNIDAPETTSEPADWGTCCHQISEACLRDNQDAIEWVGRIVKGKKFEFEVDEEMADTAQTYIDYVRGRLAAYKAETGGNAILFVEVKFSLADLKPPFEAGGTADAVIHFPAWKLLEVIDLKGGRGVVVEVKGNPQARTYGLGTMLAYPKFGVDKVMSTIVQPRAGHKDGRIRSETIDVIDLVEWTMDLKRAMTRAEAAFLAHAMVKKGETPFAAWAAEHLKSGNHCKFCPAAGFCPALEQKALDEAGVWFDDIDQPRLSNAPDMLSPERAAQLLDAADMIGDWINAVRAYWHAQAETGVEIPNYVLVEKEGREKWHDGAESQAAALALAHLDPDKVFNPAKMRTPKQVRDALKKAKADQALSQIVALSSAPKTGTNLVRADKTTRPAATPAVHKHFDIMD